MRMEVTVTMPIEEYNRMKEENEAFQDWIRGAKKVHPDEKRAFVNNNFGFKNCVIMSESDLVKELSDAINVLEVKFERLKSHNEFLIQRKRR